MKKKEKNKSYFDLFLEMSEILNQAIKTTNKTLNNFDAKSLPKQMEKIHLIESEGDEISHQIMRKLTKDFIPPLEREDIIALTHSLDDIIDSVEDIIIKMYMYNIKHISKDILEFFQIVESCSKELQKLLKELPNFKKSKNIRQPIIEINRLEELGDELYTKLMHQLYQKQIASTELISLTQIYSSLEKCCDICEILADLIDSIIMKNI